MNLSPKSLHLYAITDRQWLNGRTLESQVREVLAGGATILQLREKTLTPTQFLPLNILFTKLTGEP